MSVVIVLALVILLTLAAFVLNAKRAFRCGKNGCSGTMNRLGPRELDAYLEESASSPLPDDSVVVPAVPEVLVCDSCGEYIEQRG